MACRNFSALVMTNVLLLGLAQTTAASAVTGSMTPWQTIQAQVAAFAGTGNPDTDWPVFNQNFQREQASYRQAFMKDAAPAPAAAAPGQRRQIPANILAKLPQAIQQSLAATIPAAAAATA